VNARQLSRSEAVKVKKKCVLLFFGPTGAGWKEKEGKRGGLKKHAISPSISKKARQDREGEKRIKDQYRYIEAIGQYQRKRKKGYGNGDEGCWTQLKGIKEVKKFSL